MRRAGDSRTAEPQSWVHSIRSDGDKGVILEIGGPSPQTFHLTKQDLQTEETYSYYEQDSEGVPYVSVWTHEAQASMDDLFEGLRDYDHLNVLGTSIWISGQGGERGRLVLGQKTPFGQLPACSGASDCEARYTGRFKSYSSKATGSAEQRQRIYGNQFELTANFGRASVHGEIKDIHGQTPGASGGDPYSSWSTSRFEISDGQIAGSRLTATVTGHDNARYPNLAASLSGYDGTFEGAFYGPTGEEVGGVISATRDAAGTANDRVIEGHVVGRRSSVSYPRFDTSPISDGVNRYDWSSSPRIELYGTDDHVNAVFADGKGSHFVSYTIDGVSHQVPITPEDLGRYSGYPDVHVTTRTAGREIWYSTRPYSGTYLNVAGFHPITYASETSDTVTYGAFGYVAFGDRTDAEAMSGGTATYSGKMEAREWQSRPESASSADAGYIHGSLALTANFDRGSISGRMQSLQRRAPGSSSDVPVTGGLTLSAGRIDGNALSASLRGLGYSGSMKGAFYGPDADEVGGTLRGTKSNGDLLQGWFAGAKD